MKIRENLLSVIKWKLGCGFKMKFAMGYKIEMRRYENEIEMRKKF